MNKQKPTSLQIKCSLMKYFRFKRQWLCATECLNNDVMVIAKKHILEVEVKISKYDLWKGEAKKPKHTIYKNISHPYFSYSVPNKFYICVPTSLLEEAKKWVNEINSKYGIIEYINSNIWIVKKALPLHDNFNNNLQRSIMMRICSENIGLMENLINTKNNNDIVS